MKRNLVYILLFCLFISCQREEFVTTDTQNNSEQELTQVEIPTPQDNLDPSILNSDWWKEMNPATRQFMSIELSQSDKPITLTEIMKRKEQSWTLSAGKIKICPGYPANPEGDVTLNSQADVDAFGALKCKEIIGALVVVDTLGPDPICDLQPLKGLKEIGSSLTINSNCLTNLNGLEKLKSIGQLGPFGFIGVNGDNIVDIEALAKLSTITGSINIIDCDQLTTVTAAFSKITSIESGKTSAPLTSIYVLNVNDNAILTDLSGFSNLTDIEGGLRIIGNGSLQDLDDFSGLNNIGEDIIIVENTALLNVNELSNINSILDDLFLFDNPSLTQCCGLFNLLCSDAPTCSTDGVGDIIAIFNNGAGCTEVDIVANGPCI